jgi:hypothetical protein
MTRGSVYQLRAGNPGCDQLAVCQGHQPIRIRSGRHIASAGASVVQNYGPVTAVQPIP